MDDGELSGDVSVSLDVTETGLTASAKSRFLNAVDRTLGSYILAKFRTKAGPTIEQAALAKGRAEIIAAAAAAAVKRIDADPKAAEAVIGASFGKLFDREDNVAQSIGHTIEALRVEPPTAEEASQGPSELSPDMLNRWTRYAEDATSEELRVRWGQVLAAEIRNPGTFSSKVLRAVDELDQRTAAIFQRVCLNVVDGAIPLCILQEDIPFREARVLQEAGLMLDLNSPYIRTPIDANLNDGRSGIFYPWGDYAIGFFDGSQPAIRDIHGRPTFSVSDKGMSVPIHLLTDVGKAIYSILSISQAEPFERLYEKFLEWTDGGKPTAYVARGKEYVIFDVRTPVGSDSQSR